MLALTDEALAQLMIAATAVPAKQRRQWLEDIAARFEGRPARSSAAEKQRRYRQRQNGGKTCVRFFVDPEEARTNLEAIGVRSSSPPVAFLDSKTYECRCC
jgi:hypothetical protein